MKVKAASASGASPDKPSGAHKQSPAGAPERQSHARLCPQRGGMHPLCPQIQPSFSIPGEPPGPDTWEELRALPIRSVPELHQLLGLYPRNRCNVAVSGQRKTCSAAERVLSRSPQMKRLSSNTPHERTHQGKVFDEKLLGRCCGHTTNICTNFPEDRKLEVYSPTPKIQDSFEILNHSQRKPSTEPPPSVTNTPAHTILFQHVTCHIPNIIIHPSTYQSTRSIPTSRGWKPASYPGTATL